MWSSTTSTCPHWFQRDNIDILKQKTYNIDNVLKHFLFSLLLVFRNLAKMVSTGPDVSLNTKLAKLTNGIFVNHMLYKNKC